MTSVLPPLIWNPKNRQVVDGVGWYQILCRPEIAEYIRSQLQTAQYYEHTDEQFSSNWTCFDVDESALLTLTLKFT
jgi:hypothetical protein